MGSLSRLRVKRTSDSQNAIVGLAARAWPPGGVAGQAHTIALEARSGLTVDLADFAIASQPMMPSKAMTEFVKVKLAKTGKGPR
jgi:hypothetical protein